MAPERQRLDPELRLLIATTGLSGICLGAGFLLQRFGSALHPAWAIAAYAGAYLIGGYRRLAEGIEALRRGSLSIDMLMVMGAMGAAVLGHWSEGAVLIFLFALSNTLEEFAAGRTRRAIEALVAIWPDTAMVRTAEGAERPVPVEELIPGDVVVVRPGERLAVDGSVLAGKSAMDQSAITGESVPVAKQEGDPVYAGSLNTTGRLLVSVARPASESTLSRMIHLVEEAQEQKARSQRLVDLVDRYYTLLVVAIAALTWILPPLVAGWRAADSFYLAMQLLVVMSPCALVIATPAAILSGIAAGARQGILFKGGAQLERAGQVRVVAFDKTGTLTEGKPQVTSLRPAAGVSEDDLLRLAAAAEAHSGHPLARAIAEEAERRLGEITPADEVAELPGMGVTAQVGGQEVRIGSLRHTAPEDAESARDQVDSVEENGETAVVVTVSGKLAGIIGIADRIRPEARAAIARLREAGIQRVVMLTGDNERVAARIAAEAGVDEYRASLMPEEKLGAVEELERLYGQVAMIGDGINDAPALARASLGIAMGGAGNDAALESADLVLMTDNLCRIADAFRIGQKARWVVAENLAFSIGVILILVALSLMGALTLPLAVIGHEGSTILVAASGMRLLLMRRRAPEAEGEIRSAAA